MNILTLAAGGLAIALTASVPAKAADSSLLS